MATILNDIGVQVEGLLASEFARLGFDPQFAGLYAQALVGLVAMTGQQWAERGGEPDRTVVVSHLINLAWYGMAGLKPQPRLLVDTLDARQLATGASGGPGAGEGEPA